MLNVLKNLLIESQLSFATKRIMLARLQSANKMYYGGMMMCAIKNLLPLFFPPNGNFIPTLDEFIKAQTKWDAKLSFSSIRIA